MRIQYKNIEGTDVPEMSNGFDEAFEHGFNVVGVSLD